MNEMSQSAGIAIRGAGWVTPLGCGLDEVWQRLAAGERAEAVMAPPSPSGRAAAFIPVPLQQFNALARAPRIRRSSAISLFSLAAGFASMEQAGLPAGKLQDPTRTAVIFAICSGGVHYTRRFYEKVAAEGAQGASPLLFPETVYNAPASHLSAMLGIDGASYTVVGDGSVGLAALQFAEELLATDPELERCIVVGSEECDWILWEGYRTWRLLASEPCVELNSNKGMLLAEGAGALVVGRATQAAGEITLKVATHSYETQPQAAAALGRALAGLPGAAEAALVIGSANGTWIDRAETVGLEAAHAVAPRYAPKCLLGDALGAGALEQVIFGALALQKGIAPGPDGAPLAAGGSVLVTSIGLNQQVGGAVMARG